MSQYVAHPALHSFPTRRSSDLARAREDAVRRLVPRAVPHAPEDLAAGRVGEHRLGEAHDPALHLRQVDVLALAGADRKSTRLNSSHLGISYAVFCLKKKKTEKE